MGQPRIGIAGGVGSTRRVLEKLIRHGADIRGVLGLSFDSSSGVSGYARLDDLALSNGLPYADFSDINAPDVTELIKAWKLDVLFVVGLSQLVRTRLLRVPRIGCVGFHPTALPLGRGRAPGAWVTLRQAPGAATFFVMDKGADSGPILVQEPYCVLPDDYANDVLARALNAMDCALDHWLPEFLAGSWNPVPQDELLASYLGKRCPEDGLIDWKDSAADIRALVRAASRPHPGAYTYLDGRRLVIWKADVEEIPFKGVTGRILQIDENGCPLVQTGMGLLRLIEWEMPDRGTVPRRLFRVGIRLGYIVEDEITVLRDALAQLQMQVAILSAPNHADDRGERGK